MKRTTLFDVLGVESSSPTRTLAALSRFAVVVVIGLGVFVPAGRAGAADDDVPYSDPNAVGFIGLCDASDHPVEGGSVAAQPFVRSAVASMPAPSPYDGEGRTATLFAYQPREGVGTAEWSGQLLTASSQYSDPAHPTAVATPGDDSLTTFIDSYPAQWDGFVQLRLYLGAPGQPALTQQYAATDIRIEGDTWTVVRGGDTPCDANAARSIEELLPAGSISTAQPSVASPGAPLATAAGDSDSGSSTSVIVIVVAVVVILAGGAFFVIRRRNGTAGE